MAADTWFLPGARGERTFWAPVAERLVNTSHAHLLGYPGCGDEPADAGIHSLDDLYTWVVERLPRSPCNVVAQSMGCVIAMRLASAAPSRVRRLVLVATSGGLRARFGTDWRAPIPGEARPVIPAWFVRDRTELDAALPRITAPCLLIFGDADPLAPPQMGEYLQNLIPGARLHILRGGTHAMAQELTEEVARAIDEHLE